MASLHDEVLRELGPTLLKNLKVDVDLVSHIRAKSILTDNQIEIIENIGPPQEKVDRLIQYLRSRSRESFDDFLKALSATEWKHTKDMLEKKMQEKAMDQTAGFINIADPVEDFFIRKNTMEKVKSKLATNNKVILTGPPGAGKTQIARMTARDVITSTRNLGLCAEIHCSTINGFHSDLKKLSHSLQLSSCQEDDDRLAALVQKIKRALTSSGKEHVLIFDNVKDSKKTKIDLKEWDVSNVKIICTTNDRQFGKKHQVLIEGLDDEEVISFFNQSNDECCATKEDILKLGESVSNLMLGITAAKYYIQSTQCSLPDYLDLIHAAETSSYVAEDQEELIQDYECGLDKALSLMIGEMKKKLANAESGFSIVMFLDAASIHEDLLKVAFGLCEEKCVVAAKTLLMNKVVTALDQTSLGSVRKVQGKRVVSIHGKVQSVWRETWDEEEKKQHLNTCLETLNSICDKDTRFEADYENQCENINHALVATHFSRQKEYEDNWYMQMLRIRLLDFIGHMRLYQGQVTAAEDYLGSAIKAFGDVFLHPEMKEDLERLLLNSNHDYVKPCRKKHYGRCSAFSNCQSPKASMTPPLSPLAKDFCNLKLSSSSPKKTDPPLEDEKPANKNLELRQTSLNRRDSYIKSMDAPMIRSPSDDINEQIKQSTTQPDLDVKAAEIFSVIEEFALGKNAVCDQIRKAVLRSISNTKPTAATNKKKSCSLKRNRSGKHAEGGLDYLMQKQKERLIDECQQPVVYLVENLVSSLYSFGKAMFSDKKRDDASGQHLVALNLADALCRCVHTHCGIKLIYSLMIRRNCTLRLKLEPHRSVTAFPRDPRQLKPNCVEAISGYTELLEETDHYFEKGVLKKGTDDLYHKAFCLKQTLVAYTQLVQDGDKSVTREDMVSCAKRLQDVVEEMNQEELVTRDSFSNCIGDLYLVLSSPADLQMAHGIFKKSFEWELNRGKLRAAMIKAIKGMATSAVKLGDKECVKAAEKSVSEFTQFVEENRKQPGQDRQYKSELKLGNELLAQIRREQN